jgi:hypothetical protein
MAHKRAEDRMNLFTFGIAAFAFVALLEPSAAQDQPVRVRGTIARIDDGLYIIKARSGGEVKVKLADNAMVVALVKASLADVKQGSYIGVSGLPQSDGSQKALEIHILPEASRGSGDGHRPWDLQPSSTMTNGAVDQMSASADGQVLTLKYKDGEKKIIVPADCPIVSFLPGDTSELKPGAAIFISAAQKQSDGTLLTPRVNVGRGTAPPM